METLFVFLDQSFVTLLWPEDQFTALSAFFLWPHDRIWRFKLATSTSFVTRQPFGTLLWLDDQFPVLSGFFLWPPDRFGDLIWRPGLSPWLRQSFGTLLWPEDPFTVLSVFFLWPHIRFGDLIWGPGLSSWFTVLASGMPCFRPCGLLACARCAYEFCFVLRLSSLESCCLSLSSLLLSHYCWATLPFIASSCIWWAKVI
jgi:hypothetical protein